MPPQFGQVLRNGAYRNVGIRRLGTPRFQVWKYLLLRRRPRTPGGPHSSRNKTVRTGGSGGRNQTHEEPDRELRLIGQIAFQIVYSTALVGLQNPAYREQDLSWCRSKSHQRETGSFSNAGHQSTSPPCATWRTRSVTMFKYVWRFDATLNYLILKTVS
jgi:hypothetical protein